MIQSAAARQRGRLYLRIGGGMIIAQQQPSVAHYMYHTAKAARRRRCLVAHMHHQLSRLASPSLLLFSSLFKTPGQQQQHSRRKHFIHLAYFEQHVAIWLGRIL
jgi:hypothetical protein